MSLAHIQTLLNYNYWAHHQLFDCLETISETDFLADSDYSSGSMQVQLVHIMWAEATWYARLHDQPRPPFTAEDYPTLHEIKTKWQAIETDWRTYIASLSLSDLDTRYDITPYTGNPYHATVQEIIAHVVNHGTNHRAQILQHIHNAGGQTFEQDMSRYFRERNSS
ncbi:MAG: DinB family protein [Chloroflexota bacterium]